MSDDLTAWLRVQVEARLALAREACHGTDGHWWRRTHDLYGTGEAVPVGGLCAGEHWTEDGEVYGGEVVVYDEGAPSPEQFGHIEANDPRDAIARCEMELAILEEHDGDHYCYSKTSTGTGRSYDFAMEGCRVIRQVGYGYRHRDGYLEGWAP